MFPLLLVSVMMMNYLFRYKFDNSFHRFNFRSNARFADDRCKTTRHRWAKQFWWKFSWLQIFKWRLKTLCKTGTSRLTLSKRLQKLKDFNKRRLNSFYKKSSTTAVKQSTTSSSMLLCSDELMCVLSFELIIIVIIITASSASPSPTPSSPCNHMCTHARTRVSLTLSFCRLQKASAAFFSLCV